MLLVVAALIVSVLPLAVATINAAPAGAGTVPAGFTDTVAFSGLTQPTNIRFAPDGRIFVAEKGGQIKVFDGLGDTTPTVFADLRVETYDFWDRGLLGIALSPDWPASPTAAGNRTVYALYARDADLGGSAPKWGSATASSSEFDPCPTPPGANTDGCVISGRLVKFTASGTSDVAQSAPTTLIDGWCQQFPSHSVGDLQFGADGMLYMTGGEGANFNTIDYGQYKNLCGDPPTANGTGQTASTAEGGALRAQSALRPAGQPTLLSGSLLRVDPNTGLGVAGNPFFGVAGADANKQRIAAFGFRNPYRFTFRPGTNEAWVGNVGWATWESIQRVVNPAAAPAENFGWPCYEGPAIQPSYQAANIGMCNTLYNTPGAITSPYYSYNHANQVVPGESCPTAAGSSITGLAFYPTSGGTYPAAYNGALFFADYTRNCIWAMQVGSNGLPDPTKIVTFDAGASAPVDLVVDPNTHDLFYADLEQGTAGAGTIHRVSFQTAGPVAKITSNPNPPSGVAPLSVTFDGTTSTGTNLSYAWDLGSGNFTDATGPTASKTFTAGTYTVRLKVTSGASSSIASTTVVAGTPPVPTITGPPSTLQWSVGDPIPFSGSAVDGSGNPLPPSALSWSVLIHHCPTAGNCHVHPGIFSANGVASGSFPAPDHSYPSDVQLTLTATDPATGLSAASTPLVLQPNTTTLALQSNPAGLTLSADDTTQAAPINLTVITKHIASVSAPPTQTLGGQLYQFTSWSDGGAASHNVTVPSATTLTANYTAVSSISVPAPATGVWQVNGSATIPAAGTLQLTAATANQAGSSFYPTAVSSGTLTADFDATISGGTGADGLAFVLADPTAGATPASLGGSGGALGFVGTPGIAVALDTYMGGTNPSANFVGITDGAGTGGLHWIATSSSIPNLRTATRHVKVTVASGVMTVSVDGTQYLSQAVTLPPNVLVGFSGGTGGLTDVHSVKNVVVTSGAPASAPQLSVLPTTLSFGNVTVGTTSTAQTVAIKNVGNAAMTVSSVTGPAAPFSATGLPGAGQVINAGATVNVSVSFSPTAATASTGTIAVNTNGGNASVSLSGTGTAAAAPVLSVTPTSVPFGTVVVGSSSQATVNVKNAGNATMTVTSVTGPSSPFSATGLPAAGAQIAAGATVAATVTYTPTSATSSTGSIAFVTDGGSTTVSLSGTGTSGGGGPVSVPAPATGVWQLNGSATIPAAGTLQLTAATANQAGSSFYPTAVGSSTLTADFDATLSGGTGADGLAFILADPAAGATPTSLGETGGGLGFGGGPPGIAVTLDTYQSTGDPSANFVGITDGYGSPGVFHYLATSTTVPNLRSATRHVKVTYASGVMTVSVDGTQYLSTPVTLPPNVLVGFGGGTGGLTDVHSVKNVVITSGAATTAPALSVTPTSVPFGNVAVGTTSAAVPVTIKNVGNAPMTFTGVTGPAAPFAASGLPAVNSQLAAGATVTANVTFSPTAATASTGSLAITTNGGNATVSLTGTGTTTGTITVPAPAAATWQLNGSATLPSAGVLQLTPATTSKAGTGFYKVAVSSAKITADFDATINSGTGADGLTFILANPAAGATPTSLGGSGGALGFIGIPGVAVALDTYKAGTNPSANFVGITDGSTTGGVHWLATSTAVPNLRSATRHVKVTVNAGVLTVSIDGTQYLSQAVTLGSSVLIGFGGGTGGLTDIHSVKNVVVTIG